MPRLKVACKPPILMRHLSTYLESTMTLAEMTQLTLNHWRTHHRRAFREMTQQEAQKQAMACAHLTRKETDNLKEVGLDEERPGRRRETSTALKPRRNPPSCRRTSRAHSGPAAAARRRAEMG